MCQHLEMVPPANGCEATSKKASAPPVWPYGQHTGNPLPANVPVTAWSDNPGARPPGPLASAWRNTVPPHAVVLRDRTYEDSLIQSPRKRQHPLIKFYGHSLGTADYSYFQAIFDQIDLYGGNTTLYFLHAPRITPVFLRRFGCEFR